MVKITKKVAEKMLGEVPWNEQFICSDGRVLKSLSELEAALKEMSEETYLYHSNEVKSDFSNWVYDVIGDEKLSRELRKSTTRTQAATKVSDRIIWLKNKIVAR
jgi:hypothetical protein